MNNKPSSIRIGISTATFYPMYTESAFDIICDKLGYKTCEVFLNTQSETVPSFINQIKRKAADSGVRITSVHPYFSGYEYMLFFSGYERRLKDSVELYKMFFEAAASLGANYLVFHGAADRAVIPTPSNLEFYYEVFAALSDTAKSFGVTLAQENVSWCYCSTPDFVSALRETARSHGDRIPFVLDIKQALRANVQPVDMIDAMGEDIVHIHNNDFNGGIKLPFFGSLDFKLIFDRLSIYNYIGSFITEVYRENFDGYDEVIQSRLRFEEFLRGAENGNTRVWKR